MFTFDRFNQIGEMLYGQRWKTVLAQMMCIGARMIRYYSKGRSPIPVELIRKLQIICRSRAEAFARVADELDNYL